MKRLVKIAVVVMMMALLTACGKQEEFDAKGYVQGVLDATFHEEYAAHAEDVGETEEAVREEIEGNNLMIAKTALAGSGLETTEEEIQTYVDAIREGYHKIEYTVGDAVKDEEDNFTVDVEITPVGLLDNLNQIFTDRLTEAVNNGVDESGFMAVFIDSVKECIANAPVYEPVTYTVHVTYEEDSEGNRIYSISDEELDTLDNIAINQQ